MLKRLDAIAQRHRFRSNEKRLRSPAALLLTCFPEALMPPFINKPSARNYTLWADYSPITFCLQPRPKPTPTPAATADAFTHLTNHRPAPHNAHKGTIRRPPENTNPTSNRTPRANGRPILRRRTRQPTPTRIRGAIPTKRPHCTPIHHKTRRRRSPGNGHQDRPHRNRRRRGLNVMMSTPSPKDVVCLTSRMPDLDLEALTTSSVSTELASSDLTP